MESLGKLFPLRVFTLSIGSATRMRRSSNKTPHGQAYAVVYLIVEASDQLKILAAAIMGSSRMMFLTRLKVLEITRKGLNDNDTQ